MPESTSVNEVLQEIVTTGLLRIRSLAWSGDSGRCAIEADHIHNLPHLLVHGNPDALVHYWEVERTSYMDQTDADQIPVWEPLWRRLQPHVEAMAASSASR